LFSGLGERGLAMTVWKLDFGEGRPAAGYQRVSPSTFFHLEREFGWTDRSEIQARNRRASNGILGKFVLATSPATLRVTLDPGKYVLQVIMGDKDFPDHALQLKVSDTEEVFPLLTAEAGEYAILHTVIDVPISFLDLTFSSPVNNWIVNAVTLEPVSGGYGAGAKVTRRKFSDRFEESVASGRVGAKGGDPNPYLKRGPDELGATENGSATAASNYKDSTYANPAKLTEQHPETKPQNGHQGVITRMIRGISSWRRRGAP
jgi:hypothetical protein